MEESAEMGRPATLNRNVPPKQNGDEQGEGERPSVEWKVGGTDMQPSRTSALSESTGGKPCAY